jgi:predicted DNA-binding protein (MmcQ/YjbR family)
MPKGPIERVRKLCLALPDATEKTAWGEPTFRIKDKMFAMYADADNHHGSGRPAVWIKSTLDNQQMLIASNPDRFYKPAYVGPNGWVAVFLDKKPPWAEIKDLLEDGYQLAAPKRRRKN